MSLDAREQPPALYGTPSSSRTHQEFAGDLFVVVEILSPGTPRRDRVEKAKLYARHGVGRYRLADPEARILEVFELADGRYTRSAGLADDDSFSPSLFPGLTIPLSSLWR